jgi:DNA-binding HxlR family transcriptional regulator
MHSGFGQFCPVAVASQVFATRWTPLILRELFAGSEHFNDLHRGVPLMSRALLSRRLRELEDAGVVVRETEDRGKGHRYRLTDAGLEFRPVIEALGQWGQRWTVRVRRENLDAGFLMWNVRRRIATAQLPERRVVVLFRFTGLPASYRGPAEFWLVLTRSAAELCIEDPGFEVDLQVDADIAAMASVWLGDIRFEAALRSRSVRIAGAKALVQAFPGWLMLSKFASVPRRQAVPVLPDDRAAPFAATSSPRSG